MSDADREAEAAIVALLETERPDDGVLGEEGAAREGASGRRWVIDPLDGTTNFLYGIPFWSVSIALEDQEGSLVAVVDCPILGEHCVAERGRGCERNGDPVTVSDQSVLERALIGTGFQYRREVRERQARVLERVLPRVANMRRLGSAALDLAWVAGGRLDGFFEIGLNRWDWLAGALLVTEAGGVVSPIESDPPGVVAAGPALAGTLAALVAED